jgi:hypothetical protein
MTLDQETLKAALTGFEMQRDVLESRILRLQERLGKTVKPTEDKPLFVVIRGKGRRLSPARRKVITDAAKRRWTAQKQHTVY